MRVAHKNQQSPVENPILRTVFNNNRPRFRSRFLVNKRNSYIVLPVLKVAYFYVNGDMLYAVTFDNNQYHIDSNMKTLEEELDTAVFFRTNRQFILNINCIIQFEPYFNGKLVVKTAPESSVKMIVSKAKAKGFKEWIDR